MGPYSGDARRLNRATTAPYHPGVGYPGRDRRVPMIISQEPNVEETQSSRKRIAVACGRCRKRKIRCSGDAGGNQPCHNCRNAGAEPCEFLRMASTQTQWRDPALNLYSYNLESARAYQARSMPMNHGYGPSPDINDYYRAAPYAAYGGKPYYHMPTTPAPETMVSQYPAEPVDYSAAMYASGYSQPSSLGSDASHAGYVMPYRAASGSRPATAIYAEPTDPAAYPYVSQRGGAGGGGSHSSSSSSSGVGLGGGGGTNNVGSEPSNYGAMSSSANSAPIHTTSFSSTPVGSAPLHPHTMSNHTTTTTTSSSSSSSSSGDRTFPMASSAGRTLTNTSATSYPGDYSTSSHRGSSHTASSSTTSPASTISDAATGYTSYEGSPTMAAYHSATGAISGAISSRDVVVETYGNARAAASTEALYAGSQCSTPTEMPFRLTPNPADGASRRNSACSSSVVGSVGVGGGGGNVGGGGSGSGSGSGSGGSGYVSQAATTSVMHHGLSSYMLSNGSGGEHLATPPGEGGRRSPGGGVVPRASLHR